MKIYKIEWEFDWSWDVLASHIIVANNEDEVRQIAKNIAADEGEEIWETAEIEMFGDYTGDKKEPFIIHSHFIHA